MTSAALQKLLDEADELEAAIGQLGVPGSITGPRDRAELDRRVVQLCATAEALPPAEARGMTDTLARLVQAFDAAAQRLRAAAPSADDMARNTKTDPRRAAAAYGSATARRRRGF
ncbi:hypothetical protein [Thalassobaculum sp.]|uniref:hypothetical protein n=1 Tax=Thalassobaculum sp. TaxID=2022740 RepID=UPI0032EF523F